MHPFLSQHMAQSRREELQRAAAVARTEYVAHADADKHGFRRTFYRLIFDLPVTSSTTSGAHLSQAISPCWLQQQMRTTFCTVGLGAFGIGSLLGGFLGTKFGLLPSTLLGCIVCLAITVPILRRSLKILKEHL